MKKIAIIGGGISGLAAAYELARVARDGVAVEAVLFEASARFGGIIDTVREGGFTVEGGPDGWISAKSWARELAVELGLADELIQSNDAARKTWILLASLENPSGRLVPIPGGFHMMVPANLDALDGSPMFTPAAIEAYRREPARAAELRAAAPDHDESVADFTLRHFGPEVLERVAAPLLSGVFGGDVRRLSVRAVMPTFVQMEREHGSLIAALQAKGNQPTTNNRQPATGIFTTLRSGLGTLVDRLVAAIPPHWLRPNAAVIAVDTSGSHSGDESAGPGWTLRIAHAGRFASEAFDAVLLAAPLDASRRLLTPLDSAAAQRLPSESSSAVLVAFCYADASHFPVPPGFGFLVPPSEAPARNAGAPQPALSQPKGLDSEMWVPPNSPSLLLACTFTDQKFAHRVPPGGRLVRAFFGGAAAERIARCNNDEIAAIARLELARILHTAAPNSAAAVTPALPAVLTPNLPVLTVVRRWPNSLPQYPVGHLERIAELESRLRALPGLTLLGNALNGLGIPDLIRDARAAARLAATN